MKKSFCRNALVYLLCLSSIQCATLRAMDIDNIEKILTTTGLEGEVHAAVPHSKLYVFTYRNPDDFFDYVHMSMLPAAPLIKEQFRALSRHDRVRIHGKFLENSSPQKHISIDRLEILAPHQVARGVPAYEYGTTLPDDLLNKESATFLVHAVHAQGRILVVEYRDAVIPIFVRDPTFSKNLSRNDIVRLRYLIQSQRRGPVHLELDEEAEHPIEVIDPVANLHGKEVTVEGALVLFPKSPQVLFNVFAVLDESRKELKRQYTLVNFDDAAVFKQIREKLQSSWDSHPGAYMNGRNKLVSKTIRVRAKGRFNQVDANQANTQILLASPEAIEIIHSP